MSEQKWLELLATAKQRAKCFTLAPRLSSNSMQRRPRPRWQHFSNHQLVYWRVNFFTKLSSLSFFLLSRSSAHKRLTLILEAPLPLPLPPPTNKTQNHH